MQTTFSRVSRPGRTAFPSASLLLLCAAAVAQHELPLLSHIGGACYAVAVQGDYAFVGEGTALRILDISDPTNPAPKGQVVFQDGVRDISPRGTYVYVAAGVSGLRIVDATDPELPYEVAFYDTPGVAYGVFVTGHYAFVADESYLQVIDISDPARPSQTGYLATIPSIYDVFPAGDYAYAVGGVALQVIDVADPARPTIVGELAASGSLNDVVVSGPYAYMTQYVGGSDQPGFLVVDISDPAHPVEVGGAFDDGLGVSVSGAYAFVANTRLEHFNFAHIRNSDKRNCGSVRE